MLSIHVKLSTTLRDHVPGYVAADGLRLDLDAPATAGQVAARLSLPPEEIKIVMLNGVHASLETSLADGDRLAFFPAVGGG